SVIAQNSFKIRSKFTKFTAKRRIKIPKNVCLSAYLHIFKTDITFLSFFSICSSLYLNQCINVYMHQCVAPNMLLYQICCSTKYVALRTFANMENTWHSRIWSIHGISHGTW